MHQVNDGMGNEGGRKDEGSGTTPQVRTLLLTDLSDSTALVERLGDAQAAELFREHDRLVLSLQQRWHGRLIDRSDGLLLLFDRAIDGLGFALDYARGLRETGERRKLSRHGLTLQARAGLHVGEVLTWRNSDAAVTFGAKPLEVEGLAKPMAGRLMAMARPGQILLSATAEPLAHRAARELGERGEQLVWKAWGRWRFKGVPQAQEIYEVGEPGIAPLRPPRQDRVKAWRDIPLWRRPAALAAELLLVAGLATCGWILTRPQPAIAFAERDWVVVADLRNLTGDTLLDESLEQAFRISLEQSRYVNVLSDLKARDTLGRMRLTPDTLLDRSVASEIALRDGARAVILPTVAEVGGRVRVSAEVVDPHTQTTVYAESADGAGASSTLDSIDQVTAALRGKLGEAVKAIQMNSVSLPNVTTSNLDALKAYALGKAEMAKGDNEAAAGFYRRALELDPKFALAMAAMGQAQVGAGATVEGVASLRKAAMMRSRLPPREALQVDALVARIGPVPELLRRWRQLVEMYPDELNAQGMFAMDGWLRANRYADMLPHARAAQAPQNMDRGRAHYLEGALLLGLERYSQAVQAFRRSRDLGFKGQGTLMAFAYLAQHDTEGADRAFATREAPADSATHDEAASVYRFLRSVDGGDRESARAIASDALGAARAAGAIYRESNWRFWRLSADVALAARPVAELQQELGKTIQWVERNAHELDANYGPASYEAMLAAGYLAALLGDRHQLARVIDQVGQQHAAGEYLLADQMFEVLLAEQQRLGGDPAAAAARLERLASGDESLFLAHSALLRAYRDDRRAHPARVQAAWITSHRGRAFVERSISDLLTPVMVADTNAPQASR